MGAGLLERRDEPRVHVVPAADAELAGLDPQRILGVEPVIPHGVEVFIGIEPIDLRWGFDRLAGIAAERIGRDARSGALFVFFGRRRISAKVLFLDGTGMCLFYKRLDKGTCRIPTPLSAERLTLGQTDEPLAPDDEALRQLVDAFVGHPSPACRPDGRRAV